MKLSFSFSWTLIIVVSVLTSLGGCTIEKRLYQPGYHVEWQKRAQFGDRNEAVTDKQADQVIAANETNHETIAATSFPEEKTITEEETTMLSSAVSQALDRVSSVIEHPTASNSPTLNQSAETLDQANDTKPLLKKMSKREGGPSGLTKGLLLILMGLLLIGMGFLFQNILGVFGTILLIIFGLGGAIMIVVGIVFMILG
ncbi:MAG: hypothetical protein A3D31_08965 [Candidatus Fluviicola riflensis]|nr:MAG: hypothetical protein CHH17_13375 [Candidatus Fluviicola riflensis]OGS77141.1 MAG: hypothetical protein A3D31_08965 [Candidatus Fluviicola riflensis]OGS82076.1 MAG: hypothetical protein A2724_17910 [Fluviicola sp. RIFCSPHIGHO2_01_FULL_43_53]OGS87770.1 MAG: hypothetical protein A3E30_15345 [Fluviicola sp. RIFCSPHIGHO2_12_FULL_43_24]